MRLFCRSILFILIISTFSFSIISAKEKNYVKSNYTEYVNSYIGSLGLGNVFVGASVPFGAVQVGPMNIPCHWMGNNSGYHYDENVICGFAHTHLSGTGCADLCDIILMPYSGELRTAQGILREAEGMPDNIEGAASSYFSHDNEIVSPDYYSVKMDNGVKVELTATERVGIHRYTYSENENNRVLIDLMNGCEHDSYESYIRKVDDYSVEGYRFVKGWAPNRKVFFYATFDKPIDRLDVFNEDKHNGQDELQNHSVKGVVTFAKNTKNVQVKVSISSVSTKNAALNLKSELPGWDFNTVRQQAIEKWNNVLSTIDVEGSKDDKATFYSALYHSMINPNLYCDVNGEFRGVDGRIYRNTSWNNYTVFSLWDTYRTVNPLYTLIMPERVPDLINSMLSIYDQQGILPVWPIQSGETMCMIGYPSIPIIADAYLKGIKGFDPKRAMEAMLKTSKDTRHGGLKDVLERGYIPSDSRPGSVSTGQEFAIADWSIALMAKNMGLNKEYKEYSKRGKYYTNYWDSSIGFMRPKLANGRWKPSYVPWHFMHRDNDFTEGTGFQYTFYVPQHPEGLIELAGGDKSFLPKLDSLFTVKDNGFLAAHALLGLIGGFIAGNEPCCHMPYLYAYAGEQWKTAMRVRQIQKQFYINEPRGLIGNDDCGALSAWHVLSALGFYQVNPSHGVFVFGSPLFTKATINVGDGKRFTVIAKNNNEKNIYIQSAKLNGQPYPYTFINYDDIMKGGTLEFVMGPKPNKNYGLAKAHRPVSAE